MIFRYIAALLVLVAVTLNMTQPVQAKGLFEAIFGSHKKREAPVKAPAPRRRQPAKPKGPIVPHMILAGGTAIEILVVGDSLASNLWQGMRARFKNHANVSISRLTRNSSGIVRDDFYDWNKAVRTQMEAQRADIVVFMIGLNDAQRFLPSKVSGKSKVNNAKRSKTALFSSPLWQQTYAARVDALLQYLGRKKSRVYWVGLPIMRKRTLSEDMSFINDIFRVRAEQAGAKFIDIWEAFSGEDGAYSRFGPDLNGRIRNLRAKNGIHFTNAGAKKLAHYPATEIFADFGSSPLAQQSPLPGLNTNPRTRVLIAPGGQPPFNVQQMAPALIGSRQNTYVNPYLVAPLRPFSERLLVQGEALRAEPGRADDFSWPRE